MRNLLSGAAAPALRYLATRQQRRGQRQAVFYAHTHAPLSGQQHQQQQNLIQQEKMAASASAAAAATAAAVQQQNDNPAPAVTGAVQDGAIASTTTTTTNTTTASSEPELQMLLPALPAPESSSSGGAPGTTTNLEVDGPAVTLDHLGPMVVGRDGTLSRIANWAELTPIERQNTLRVLGKRNQLRMANLRDEEDK
ncbi:hypothetical protein B0T17DRAFT_385632 [Bombardia bombarda]|uniref:Uncharacterized protein n=1 Tax=Bombardia bombarda TaxID=252184 RepID=A0AA39W4Y1_9PEZI|nr:hypothetical protein B0T17DRAFT_385632 [Bombardia bombarda]